MIENQTPKQSILVVDDDTCGLSLLKLFLQTQGYVVLTAATIEEAMRHAETGSISAVISDLSLKDESGLDLMRELRKRSVVPGIALSGYSDPEHRSESQAAGFAEHLSKPVDLEVLLQSIRRVTSDAEVSASFAN